MSAAVDQVLFPKRTVLLKFDPSVVAESTTEHPDLHSG